MSTAFCREQLLCKVVLSECLEVFDYIIIDCLPSLGILLTNALATADSVLIPVQTQKFALDGLQALFDIISLVKNSLNPKLEVLGIVATMVDNTNMTKNALELLKGSGALLQSKISRSVSATNSTSEQKSLVKIGGKLGQEYVTLTEEIIKSFEVK